MRHRLTSLSALLTVASLLALSSHLLAGDLPSSGWLPGGSRTNSCEAGRAATRVAEDSDSGGEAKFLRFVDEGQGRGRLETAVVRYRDRAGRVVDLIAAVHIADGSYYARLAEHFTRYESLLYEMIKDKDVVPRAGERGDSLLSIVQRGMKQVLELEFQLDGIDYTRPNFVHADMDPASFFRAQAEKGESLLTLMLRSMRTQWKLQAEGKGRSPSAFDLIAAFASPDSSRALKHLFAREMESMEALLAGIEGEEGSVIVAERNKVAMGVLESELAKGRSEIGIFYGAAHMGDFEKRLAALGFEPVDTRWLVAWDIGSSRARELRGAEPDELREQRAGHPARRTGPRRRRI